MIPVIIFSFSRKECEAYAMQMTNLDFNTGGFFLLSKKFQLQCLPAIFI